MGLMKTTSESNWLDLPMLVVIQFMVLVSSKDVAGVDLRLDVVERWVVAVGDDSLALALEAREVVYYLRAEEHRAILQRGLIDDDLGTLGLDAFHHALYRRLAEVIRARLHR